VRVRGREGDAARAERPGGIVDSKLRRSPRTEADLRAAITLAAEATSEADERGDDAAYWQLVCAQRASLRALDAVRANG
jgi:hypothetical protein